MNTKRVFTTTQLKRLEKYDTPIWVIQVFSDKWFENKLYADTEPMYVAFKQKEEAEKAVKDNNLSMDSAEVISYSLVRLLEDAVTDEVGFAYVDDNLWLQLDKDATIKLFKARLRGFKTIVDGGVAIRENDGTKISNWR